jgi:hypothetical protein
MSVKTIDLEENPASLDELLALLRNNDEILLTKGDVPLARLSGAGDTAAIDLPRVPGLHAGTTWISDDFDVPLPDEFWLGE